MDGGTDLQAQLGLCFFVDSNQVCPIAAWEQGALIFYLIIDAANNPFVFCGSYQGLSDYEWYRKMAAPEFVGRFLQYCIELIGCFHDAKKRGLE